MERVKRLRKGKGLTQAQLAKELHISQQRISAYESGNISIPTEVLKKYAEYFNESIDYILEHEIDKNVISEETKYTLNPEEVRLVDSFRNVSKDSRRIVQNVMEACLDNEKSGK